MISDFVLINGHFDVDVSLHYERPMGAESYSAWIDRCDRKSGQYRCGIRMQFDNGTVDNAMRVYCWPPRAYYTSVCQPYTCLVWHWDNGVPAGVTVHQVWRARMEVPSA